MSVVDTADYLLQHTASIMSRQVDQALQERLGVGMAQYRILLMLQLRSGIGQKVLADWLGQTEASVSRQMKLLKEKAMVVTAVNTRNRRERFVTVTPKGEKLMAAAQEVIEAYHASIFSDLSAKEMQRLHDALRAIHAQSCQKSKPYSCDHPGDFWLA